MAEEWFDPDGFSSFEYSMRPLTPMSPHTALFTRIADFPVGFQSLFSVEAEGMSLGLFGPGDSLDFVALLGHGVSEFVVRGIQPTPGAGEGFALNLEFDRAAATVLVTGLDPLAAAEPGALALSGLGLLLLLAARPRSVPRSGGSRGAGSSSRL